MADQQQDQQPIGNIRAEYNSGSSGMNMDNTVNQVPKGVLTYALNGAVENFDANSINYQNEPGNEFCLQFPEGYQLIGNHPIYEQNRHIFFLANPETGDSEIGYMLNNNCIYHTYINTPCLNFNFRYPIHKVVHKITSCATEIYWTDGFNPRRYLNIDDVTSVYKVKPGTDVCANETIPEIDCNKLKIQPNFSIPSLTITDIATGGDLKAGTYQFAIQYCDSVGDGFTSYYSITNPVPIADTKVVTLNFDYQVGKSIEINITNIDTTGYYKYFNLAVIKSINAITSVELIGTYFIDKSEEKITYTGQNKTDVRLSIDDIFEKFPYYDIAQDLTTAQDILIWDNLTSVERINYQKIANKIKLQWETHRLPAGENYADELNAANYRGYLRDEVYAFEIVFLLKNGKQTDGFHIPGRALSEYDKSFPDVPDTNADFVGEPTYYKLELTGNVIPKSLDPKGRPAINPQDALDTVKIGYSPYWKIYNTGRKVGDAPEKQTYASYKGPWEYGDMAYWESTELYPCNEAVWGELSNQPIRHHKFPDVLVSPVFESGTPTITSEGKYTVEMKANDAIFPIGVRIDVKDVYDLIQKSDLTQEQKDDIVAFKIVRADRATNKSIVAKGILRNVGKYDREGTSYYYPNYPYNDLREDPFLLVTNNAYLQECKTYTIQPSTSGQIEYRSCNNNRLAKRDVVAGQNFEMCSLDYPGFIGSGSGRVGYGTYEIWNIRSRNTCDFCAGCGGWRAGWYNEFGEYQTEYVEGWPTNSSYDVRVKPGSGGPTCIEYCGRCGITIEYLRTETGTGIGCGTETPLNGFKDEDNKYRLIFNSPETSFGNPFLGNILKLENVMYGAGKGHFVQVEKNAYYKLLSYEAQVDALNSAGGAAGGDVTALFTAYQAYLTIYINGITRRNYAYSFNSRANYDYHDIIPNGIEIKQRTIDVAQYLVPAVQSISGEININNWNRESSVFLKTTDRTITKEVYYKIYNICNTVVSGFDTHRTFIITDPNTLETSFVDVSKNSCESVQSTTYPRCIGYTSGFTITETGSGSTFTTSKISPLPYPDKTQSIAPSGNSLISDTSRFTISGGSSCSNPENEVNLNTIAYYGSIKNIFINQYGQIYSYNTIDTGFQQNISELIDKTTPVIKTVFGGDTFINRFTFKTKLPFFIDNRVKAPDDSDVFYDEIGNIAYPKYWHSSRSMLYNWDRYANIISIKAHNFDCKNNQNVDQGVASRMYYDGYFYLFAYGIPNFYCESSYNVDLRQAFNNREGEFWPHVSTGIPDDWLQESFVPIAQDNTYYYNVTYSKQNKENFFSHLPIDWNTKMCHTYFPFRAIYSDVQSDYSDRATNNWLIYRPVSKFDFPQNYGNLISLDGIQNKAILARFENKTLLYNKLLTIDTSNPKAAYVGNNLLFASAPPIDFAETDLGYIGSQNKMLLKIPQGQISVDAKRGQVFILTEQGAVDLSQLGSGMNRFFTDHLAFEIKRYFPTVDTDNNYTGIGLHGVYDSKFDRVIISKLDYIPQPGKIVKYDDVTREFYTERTVNTTPNKTVIKDIIDLNNTEYFCNKSWTLSYNVNTKSWISFHSYIPNFYIAENNFYYSGLNSCCDDGLTLDVFSTIVLPPESTTTTTSTKYTTTSTTTAKPLDCDIVGEVKVNDCIFTGTAIISTIPCNCYTLTNLAESETGTYSYIMCDGTHTDELSLAPAESVGICAQNNSINVSKSIVMSDALGSCTEDFECTTTTTTSTTTTQCPNCKTYTLVNSTSSSKTISNLVDCITGLLYTFIISANSTRHTCSCNPPTVPTGVTSTEFGSGCTTCFCYTLTNIQGQDIYVPYVDCSGQYYEHLVPAYSSSTICAAEDSIILPSGISISGGTTGCTVDGDCTCLDC